MTEIHYAVPFMIPSANTEPVQRRKLSVAYANLSAAQQLDVHWPEQGDGPFTVILAAMAGVTAGKPGARF